VSGKKISLKDDNLRFFLLQDGLEMKQSSSLPFFLRGLIIVTHSPSIFTQYSKQDQSKETQMISREIYKRMMYNLDMFCKARKYEIVSRRNDIVIIKGGIIIKFFLGKKYSFKKDLSPILDHMKIRRYQKLLYFYDNEPTRLTKTNLVNEFKNLKVDFINVNLLIVDLNHNLLPNHRKLSPDEQKKFMANKTLLNLKWLSVYEPIAIWNEFQVGDVIEIDRTGTLLYIDKEYRIVTDLVKQKDLVRS
jgi:DNA-directed RNA polymerase subunit H (RpoH/RPB5)